MGQMERVAWKHTHTTVRWTAGARLLSDAFLFIAPCMTRGAQLCVCGNLQGQEAGGQVCQPGLSQGSHTMVCFVPTCR